MNVLLIAFDFHRLGERYLALRALIESSFPGCWHYLEGTYIVRTPLTTIELRDMLKPTLGEDDELLVINLAPGSWAWRGNAAASGAWLRKYL